MAATGGVPSVIASEEEREEAPDDADQSETGEEPLVVSLKRERRLSEYNDVPFGLQSFDSSRLIALYSRPLQRQKWGDAQILPRTDWGDIFFDLFYVAAAYNVGNILVDSPTGTGALYFAGTFLPIMNMWIDKIYYDSRFVVGDDLSHRLFEVSVLLIVATAVANVREVEIMSHPADNNDMLAFSLALGISSLFTIVRYVETYFFGKGQTAVIKHSSWRDIKFTLIPLVFYVAAAIVAGIEYFSNDTSSSTYGAENENATSYTVEHRDLAEETGSEPTNVPIYLCLFGPIASYVFTTVTIICFFPNDGSHKQFTIPINVDFTIHRNGEWIMLMLGEAVLGLLIVDAPEGSEYFIAFYSGILTVILGQYLHFRSQPHHADDHAMRRSKNAGILWRGMNIAYSAGLICIGVSYQLFMLDFTYEDVRRLEETTVNRLLAGGGGASSMDPDQRRQNVAHLFCIAMAITWISHDTMLFLHFGFHKLEQRCRCEHSHKFSRKIVFFLFLRLCLLVFVSTLSQWETDPTILAVTGLVCVVVNLVLRIIGSYVIPEVQESNGQEEAEKVGTKDEQDAEPEEHKGPNVTHGAVHKPQNQEGQE